MHREDGQPIIPLDEITKEKKSRLAPIQVSSRAEYKADQRPVSFTFEGNSKEIMEIIFAWIEENPEGTQRRFCYEVVTEDHEKNIIIFHQQKGCWFLRLDNKSK